MKINGVPQAVTAGTDSVAFNGLGGYDTVDLVSLAADANDRAELWPDHGTFTSGGVTFTLTGVESIKVAGRIVNHDRIVARPATEHVRSVAPDQQVIAFAAVKIQRDQPA